MVKRAKKKSADLVFEICRTLDISKQMLGQLFVHTLNVILSSLGSIASEGANNPCSLYFLNIAIDTTIGELWHRKEK